MKSIAVLALAVSPAMLFAQKSEMKHITAAAEVFQEIESAPDKGIPHEILDKAQCVGIIPNLKRAGFVVGAKYGKGVLVCRTSNGGWSAPEIVRIEGGSFGLQIGAGETDVVFVVQNRSGEAKLLHDKFTFGGDASAMAGPIGRDAAAQTDAQLHAEILSYSRARGLFAGISLEGSTLRPDQDDNRALYGHDVSPHDILEGDLPHPAVASQLYAELNRYSGAPNSTRSADRQR
jgi:lipid-binding SYLF domain-containing protein